MAAEAWKCPVCRDVRQDVAYTTPCNHMFCLGCIQRWAKLRDSCPLCRTAMQTIRVSVRGDNQYVECIVSPPAVPVPISFSTTTATGPDSAEEFLPPPPPPSPLGCFILQSKPEWSNVRRGEGAALAAPTDKSCTFWHKLLRDSQGPFRAAAHCVAEQHNTSHKIFLARTHPSSDKTIMEHRHQPLICDMLK